MKIAILQSPLIWENPKANRIQFEEKINAIPETVDLIVLPEMFSTGFTMNPEQVAEMMDGETIAWLKSLSEANNVAITGSLVIEENGNYYNRLVFVFPSGEIQFYNKRHTFTLAGEDKVYTAGKEKLIVEYKGFKICPLICYDLRFPVFARNVENYDVLLFVANWPESRIQAWNALLKARAIENMSYVVGVNRIGVDQNNLTYNGNSQALDCLGVELVNANEIEGIFIATLDKKSLDITRSKLGFLNDMDVFTVKD